MKSRTGLELHADVCRVVEVDVSAGGRDAVGHEVRVRKFHTTLTGESASTDFTASVARLRETERFAREVVVTCWGLRSTHQFVRLPPTADEDLEGAAVREAKEEIALLETDGSRARIASTIGAGVSLDEHQPRNVSLTAASSADIERRIQPLVDAGFDVVRVLTPAMSLTAVARGRHDLVPGSSTMYVALAPRATCVAIVKDGVLLMARELPWGHVDGDGEEPFDRRLASELRRSLSFFRQTFRSNADAIACCGDVPQLRALTGSLAAALRVPAQTLDSLTGIDAEAVPEPADIFRADVAALRLAIASAAEPEPFANLLRSTVTAPRRSRGRLRYLAMAAVAALVAGVVWYTAARSGSQSSPPSPRSPSSPPRVLDSARLDARMTSAMPPALPTRRDTAGEAPPSARPREREIVVSSILYSADRQLALVDGRIAGIGDRVGGSRIVEIQPRAIVVESEDGRRRTVELRGAAAQRGAR